jgi:hypothetical protein
MVVTAAPRLITRGFINVDEVDRRSPVEPGLRLKLQVIPDSLRKSRSDPLQTSSLYRSL